MFLSDEALSFEHQLDQYRWMLNGNPANDDDFGAEAAQMHALLVIDGVNDLRVRAVQAGGNWSGDLHAHLVYGVGRRTGDIWGEMRKLVSIAPANRNIPLTSHQSNRASRALNTIYINIRGTLDNLAWAVIEKAGGQKAVKLGHNAVDLFGPRFLAVEAFGDLPAKLEPLAAWNTDVKNRRNPAAHRIPLAVIPAMVDEAQAAEIQRLTAEMFAPLRAGGLEAPELEQLMERHEAIKLKIETIGSYRPLFAHMPTDGFVEIYPTVAEDVGQMVRAGRIVLDYLAAGQATTAP